SAGGPRRCQPRRGRVDMPATAARDRRVPAWPGVADESGVRAPAGCACDHASVSSLPRRRLPMRKSERWLTSLRLVERAVVLALVAMMSVIIVLATIDVLWVTVAAIASPPVLLVSVSELLDIFSAFLLVLIGLELLETVHGYLADQVIRVESVLGIALIVIARKVIVMDFKAADSQTMLAMAALIGTLAGAYYVVRRARRAPTDR